MWFVSSNGWGISGLLSIGIDTKLQMQIQIQIFSMVATSHLVLRVIRMLSLAFSSTQSPTAILNMAHTNTGMIRYCPAHMHGIIVYPAESSASILPAYLLFRRSEVALGVEFLSISMFN